MEQIERIDYPKVPIDTTGTDAVGNRADQLPPGRRNTRFGGTGPAFFGAGPVPTRRGVFRVTRYMWAEKPQEKKKRNTCALYPIHAIHMIDSRTIREIQTNMLLK